MNRLPVTLITTVFNEGESIDRFLESIATQTCMPSEVVIVDGGSSDDTIDRINRFIRNYPEINLRLIIDNTCSKAFCVGPIARGRNIAISAAKYDILVATDAGCVLDPDWVRCISTSILQGEADVVSGWYEPLGVVPFQKLYFELFVMPKSKITSQNFLPSSRSIAFKKNAWIAIGGYPETSYTAEDTLFNLRLKAAGQIFKFSGDAIVYWDCPRCFSEVKSKFASYAHGEGLNRMYVIRYILRFFTLLFPLGLIGPKYRPYFFEVYLIGWARCAGYISGFWASICSMRGARKVLVKRGP